VRLHYALFVLLFTTSYTTAQEEPLPAVVTRTVPAADVMLIATAVEPLRVEHAPTLAEAARLNDFNTFDALYREAKERGEAVAQYETLHQLWTYAMTNPIGSFYGEEMYERLARVYPGYAEFIDQHRIVDSHGNVFYPTTETRMFVLERALQGRAPRVMVAEDLPGPPKPAPVVATAELAGGLRARRSTSTEPKVASPSPAVSSPVERRALSPSSPAPVVVAETPAAPVVVEAPPVVAATPAPQPVAVQPVAVPPVPAPLAPAATTPTEKSASSRGILLIIIGLLGVGLLAVMFRTPQETLPPIIDVKPEQKPAAPVEPLRRPEGPQPVGKKNRANGSRG
jgi:hypothetical protein